MVTICGAMLLTPTPKAPAKPESRSGGDGDGGDSADEDETGVHSYDGDAEAGDDPDDDEETEEAGDEADGDAHADEAGDQDEHGRKRRVVEAAEARMQSHLGDNVTLLLSQLHPQRYKKLKKDILGLVLEAFEEVAN